MNLKELREKNKLSQAAFASTLGVSGKSIYLIEAGRMKLSKKLSDKIAEVYGEVIEPAEKKAKEVEKKAKEVEKKAKVVEKKAKTAVADAEKKADKAATAAAEAVLDAEKKIDRRKRRTKAALQADKPSAEMTTEAVAAVVEKQAEKAKRGRRKVKAAVETAVAKAMPAIVIQSPLGGEITPEEIIAKTGPADKIYVRIDQNKAYWVRGEETGDVDLW